MNNDLDSKDWKEIARGYALKNAISHKGKANQGAVISSLFAEGLQKSQIKNVVKEVSQVINEVNSLLLDEQEKQFKNYEENLSERDVKKEGELPDLPLTNKQEKEGIVMRIAPSASGPLHLIHGINASLSYDFVLKYGGKFYVRIEDTDPENIDPNVYEMIEEDVRWLTKNNAIVLIQSDRMEVYYDYAVNLISSGNAYVCHCSSEDFKNYVNGRKDCPCRNKSVQSNFKEWEKMLSPDNSKNYNQGEVVLRFKTPVSENGMKNKNPAMRDFPLARINETEHPRQMNEYRVWPLMNLAVSADDIEMGMTHVIRGKDHRDNAQRQRMIFSVLNKKYPWAGFLGKYHFKDMTISTSKFRKEINEGKYFGWDDPKLPTLQSLKKKYKPEAFWKMAAHIGLSEVDKTMNKEDFFENMDRFNKEE